MGPWTVREFAKILGFDEETVTLWCRLGRVKAKKYGGRWRIYTDPTKP